MRELMEDKMKKTNRFKYYLIGITLIILFHAGIFILAMTTTGGASDKKYTYKDFVILNQSLTGVTQILERIESNTDRIIELLEEIRDNK